MRGCPFCGSQEFDCWSISLENDFTETLYAECAKCGAKMELNAKNSLAAWNKRVAPKKMKVHGVRMNLYNAEKTYSPCTVTVWRNTFTGRESWGWKRDKKM